MQCYHAWLQRELRKGASVTFHWIASSIRRTYVVNSGPSCSLTIVVTTATNPQTTWVRKQLIPNLLGGDIWPHSYLNKVSIASAPSSKNGQSAFSRRCRFQWRRSVELESGMLRNERCTTARMDSRSDQSFVDQWRPRPPVTFDFSIDCLKSFHITNWRCIGAGPRSPRTAGPLPRNARTSDMKTSQAGSPCNSKWFSLSSPTKRAPWMFAASS